MGDGYYAFPPVSPTSDTGYNYGYNNQVVYARPRVIRARLVQGYLPYAYARPRWYRTRLVRGEIPYEVILFCDFIIYF